MDALRRAEAEKKAAAKSKSEGKIAGASDPQQVSSDGLAEDDEDLGATIKLDRLPLPISSSSNAETTAPTVEDITASIEDSLNDLSIDFESTSPRMRSEEILSSEAGDRAESDSNAAKAESEAANQEQAFDFSIHAEPRLDSDGKPLALEPMHDVEITSDEPIPEAITGRTETLPSVNKIDEVIADRQFRPGC